MIWSFVLLDSGGGGFYGHRKGKMVFDIASAYSGGVFSKTFEGDFLLLLLTAVWLVR